MALVEALAGDRAVAVASLEELILARPTFLLPRITLSMLYLDQGDSERALAVAQEASRRAANDPWPAVLEARALRRLGQLGEAQTAVDRALRLDPELGSVQAIAGALSLDRGDFAAAESRLRRAIQLSPGDGLVLSIRAELAVATGSQDRAREAVQEALAALRSNPFSIANTELGWLEEQWKKLAPEPCIAGDLPIAISQTTAPALPNGES